LLALPSMADAGGSSGSRAGIAAAAIGLIALASLGPGASPPSAGSLSSFSALHFAENLREAIESIDYDDPRLTETSGFIVPDPSLAGESRVPPSGDPAEGGYSRTWRITEHEPAPHMKTIEIRVRWPRPGTSGEITVVTVKAG
jgi:hypothetical protein